MPQNRRLRRVPNRENERLTWLSVHHLTVEISVGNPEQAWIADPDSRDSISSADLQGGEID